MQKQTNENTHPKLNATVLSQTILHNVDMRGAVAVSTFLSQFSFLICHNVECFVFHFAIITAITTFYAK